jgi:chitinase
MSLNVQFSISSSWGSGGQGTIIVKNIGTSPVLNWKVVFVPTNFSLTSISDFSLKGGQINTTTEISSSFWSTSKSLNPGMVLSSPFNYSGSSAQLKLIDTDPISQFSGVESTVSLSSTPVPSTPVPSTPQTSRQAFLESMGGKRSIVYYPNYAVYGRKYYPSEVDGSLITDIIISFLCPNPNERDYKILKDNWQFPIPEQVYQTHKPPIKPELHMVSHDEWADFGMTLPGSASKGVIPAFVELKQKYPHLKIHVADGGWSLSWIFSKMSDPVLRKNHVDSIVRMLIENNLDGLNLDWEYPGRQGIGYNYINYGGIPDEQTQTLFIKELRKALDLASPNKYLEISVTYGADPLVIKQHKNIIHDVDWLGIMTYDFTGSWTNDTSFHSGVYIDPNDTSLPQGFCGADAVSNTLSLGIDPSKVIFGIPTYGRGWKSTPSTTIFGKGLGPASSLDPAEYSENGNTSWRSINSAIKSGAFQNFDSNTTLSAWGKDSTNQLWTYDNPTTTTQKVDFALSQRLGGVLFWDIVSDVKDLKSQDSLIGTATRRLMSNKGKTITGFKPGNITQNVNAVNEREFVPPGGTSGVNTTTGNVPTGNVPTGNTSTTGNTTTGNTTTGNAPTGNTSTTGNTTTGNTSTTGNTTTTGNTGLKVVSVTLLNDSNESVIIEPKKSIVLVGYLE